MKKTAAIILSALMLTSAAFAANSAPAPAPNDGSVKPGQQGPNFAAHKQKILGQIAQRIQRLQTVQACVQAAQDHQALKACRESGGRN